MNREPLRAVTDDEIETFDRDGVVLLKGLFDAEWVARLRELADIDMNSSGELKHELVEPGGDGRFYVNTFLWPRNDAFRDFVFNSPASQLAASIMGANKINIVFDQFLIKEPETPKPTVWHQDLPYWPINGDKVCTLWLALDEVTVDSGAVEYVKGSHKWGNRYAAVAFRSDIEYSEQLPPVPDIDAMRDELEFVIYELEPGDCTLHHGLSVHGAGGNMSSERRRRAYTTRWAGDGVTYYPRDGIQPMLWEPDIEEGQALDCDLWPKVWPRAGTA